MMEEDIDEALAGVHDEPSRVVIFTEIAEARAWSLLRDGNMGSLAEFEACLRDIGSKVYSLAIPPYAKGKDWRPVNPLDVSEERQFTLAVVWGESEATQLMQEWEISAAENMNRLAVAGIMQASR